MVLFVVPTAVSRATIRILFMQKDLQRPLFQPAKTTAVEANIFSKYANSDF